MATQVSLRDLPDYSHDRGDMGDVIRTAVEDGSRNLRVCMPARVTRVRGNQLVDVQPLFKAKYHANTAATSLPEVCRCPVLAPIGQNYAIVLPIAVGDTGLIACADRSLDTWMEGSGAGGEVDPIEARLHALTDAIFIPGMVPEAKQTTEPASRDLVLRNGDTQIRLEPDGMVRIINAAGHELVDLTVQLVEAVSTLTNILAGSQTITMLGPSPTLWAASQAQLTSLQQTLKVIEQYTTTLRGS